MSHDLNPAGDARRDWWIGAAVFAGSVAYILQRPHNLLGADEAYYLGIAKRLLQGEVLYRDVFDFLPPLFHWFLVATYALFGVTIEASRAVMAVCQGVLCLLLYLSARGIGAAIPFAVCAALAHLALAQSIWPYVSPHWISTLLMTLLFYLMFARRWLWQDRRAFPLGLVVGVLCCVQQQKGATVAIGVAVVVVLARAFGGRAARAERWASIRRSFPLLVGGAFCVAVPCLSIAMAMAGAYPVFDALVTTLRDYAAYHHQRASWAQTYMISAQVLQYSKPIVVRWAAPIVLVLTGVQAAIRWRSRDERDDALSILWQILFALSWIAAVAYFPDFIHVAFVTPVFFVLGAAALERLFPRHTTWGRAVGLAVAAAIALALGIKMDTNARLYRREFPIVRQTAFGNVAYAHPRELWLLDRVDRELDETGDRQLFFYPVTSLYLTADARNPTRHQFLLAGFNTPQHFHEVEEGIEKNDPPILLFAKVPSPRPEYQHLIAFIEERYVQTESEIEGIAIYVRRPGRPVRGGAPTSSGR